MQPCNIIIPKFIEGSTCFEQHTAHHQEPQTVFAASGLYTHVVTGCCLGWVGTVQAVNAVWSSWWWAVCRWKHVKPSINFGIINSITKLHLVGYFYWFILSIVHHPLHVSAVSRPIIRRYKRMCTINKYSKNKLCINLVFLYTTVHCIFKASSISDVRTLRCGHSCLIQDPAEITRDLVTQLWVEQLAWGICSWAPF